MVVSTSAVDCMERFVSERTYYVSSGTLKPTHSLTHNLVFSFVVLVLVIFSLLARDTFVRTNRRAIVMMFVRLSVRLPGTDVHCDYIKHGAR